MPGTGGGNAKRSADDCGGSDGDERAGKGGRHTPPPGNLAAKAFARQAAAAAAEPVNLTGPPEHILYEMFFQQVNQFAAQAAKREAQGEEGPMTVVLKSYYIFHGGLTQGENDEVYQVAADFGKIMASITAQRQQILTSYRAAMQKYQVSEAPKPDPPAPRLGALARQRDAAALAARQQLETLLGPDGFYRLEVYVHGSFGNARTAKLPMPPGAGGPGRGTGGGQ